MSNAEDIARETIPNPQNGSDLAYTWGETKQIMQAHTNQTLQELKEKVEDLTVDESIYADMCYNDAILNVMELIDEAINE